MNQLSILQNIAVWTLPVLLAITLHEAAHAYVAYRLGDSTAKMMGRLSINPFKHIDPIGTVILPLLVGFLSGFRFIFGYAKPVPVNFNQLRNPRRDMVLVTIAGPLSNFLMAFAWALLMKIIFMMNVSANNVSVFLILTARAGIFINLVLAFLNLVPIPPLDGSRVVTALLPARQALLYNQLEPYGFIILILLLVTGVLGWLLFPLISFSANLLFSFASS